MSLEPNGNNPPPIQAVPKKPKNTGGIFLLLFLVATPFFVKYMMSLGADPAAKNSSSTSASSTATPPNAPASQPADTASPAVKLATLDTGQYVDPSDAVIKKYQAQFDSLRALSPEVNDSELSNMAYIVSQDELKKGVEESSLSVLEAVNQVCPSDIPQGKHLADIFAAYATLRRQGMGRDEAISQLHGLMGSIAHPGQ